MFNYLNIALNELREKLEVRVNPEYAAYLMEQIPKGESIFAQSKPGTKGYQQVIGPLTLMYMEMNNQLGLVCQAMGYPLNQQEWEDTEPLSVLALIYPEIQSMQWYQNQLLAGLGNRTNHPWLKLTSISERMSPSSSHGESARDLIPEHEFVQKKTKGIFDAD